MDESKEADGWPNNNKENDYCELLDKSSGLLLKVTCVALVASIVISIMYVVEQKYLLGSIHGINALIWAFALSVQRDLSKVKAPLEDSVIENKEVVSATEKTDS